MTNWTTSCLFATFFAGLVIPAAQPGRPCSSWHDKGAFRAGVVTGPQWDEANIGAFSAAMGYNTIARGPTSLAVGDSAAAIGESSVAIGLRSQAGGHGSVALGSHVSASTNGSFVFGDRSTTVNTLALRPNQFLVRAAGGTRIYSNASLTAGVDLPQGAGAWSSISDANMKERFHDLDGDDVLTRIARMPVREWSYKAQDASIRHVGPTAQDFYVAFQLGEDRRRISTIDADGIALRAIQALEVRTRELMRENAALQDRLVQLETRQR